MKIGDSIDKVTLGDRPFDVSELFNALKGGGRIIWSWGAHAWTAHKDKWLRFKANGHHHKGHVYITLAFDDTFTIYYTTTRGTIKGIDTNVYIDVLIETIDNKIEYIKDYN